MTKWIVASCVALMTLTMMGNPVSTQPILLESEIIKLIDGKSYGVTGYKIKLMLQLLLKLNTLQGMGKSNEEGQYIFEGKKYTLTQMTNLEAVLEKSWSDRKTMAAADRQSLAMLEKEIALQQQTHAKALEEAIKDFDRKVAPFMEDARGAKAQLFALIQESCKKRNRLDSFLLTWADAEEGHETSAMQTQITSFKSLSVFCQDLIMFLKDMINSCPKAVAQYQELKAQYAQHKGAAQ